MVTSKVLFYICFFLICRMKSIVDHFKMALDCFFAVWFVVGNVWVFGGHSSSHDAPNLYRYESTSFLFPFLLCTIWMLTFSSSSCSQVMYRVPCIQLYWLCFAFHSMCNYLLLLPLHYINHGLQRGYVPW